MQECFQLFKALWMASQYFILQRWQGNHLPFAKHLFIYQPTWLSLAHEICLKLSPLCTQHPSINLSLLCLTTISCSWSHNCEIPLYSSYLLTCPSSPCRWKLLGGRKASALLQPMIHLAIGSLPVFAFLTMVVA